MISFVIGSCKDYQDINFNPDFYLGSYKDQAIMNEYGDIVYANEKKFNEFSCLSKEKVQELADIIKDAKLPKEVKKNLINDLKLSELRDYIKAFHSQ